MKTIKFELVTPERVVLRDTAVSISVPTQSGEITILPDHIPLVSIMSLGVIELRREDGSSEVMSVAGGFVEVLEDKVVILAQSAHRGEELDEEEIRKAMERAKQLKESAASQREAELADHDTRTELVKEKALSRWRKLKNVNPNK
jgi:F-type H+-transporting ATPase subunit epsilon